MTKTQMKWFNSGTVAAFLRGLARGFENAAAEIEEKGIPVPLTTGNAGNTGAPGSPAGDGPDAAAASNGSAEADSGTRSGESEPGGQTAPAGGESQAPGSEPGPADFDVEGIPWDARIHSGAKSKTKDGCWRIKKGADPALVQSVTAELKAAAPAENVPEPPANQPDLGGIPEPPGSAPDGPASDDPKTFPEFMAALTPHLTAGKITQEQIDHIASKNGLSGALELLQREDLIPAILAECLALCQTTQN